MKKNINLFDNSDWTDAPGYPAGTRMKTLFDDKGVKTVLLNVPGGFSMDAHSHDTFEQLYVLSGEISVGGELGTEGSCFNFKAKESHGPFVSKKGITALVFRYPL